MAIDREETDLLRRKVGDHVTFFVCEKEQDKRKYYFVREAEVAFLRFYIF